VAVVDGIGYHTSTYDALLTSYRLSCPRHGQTTVRLSRFRRVDELPGPNHPTIYRIEFACGCGEEHPGLVSHSELDWEPLGLDERTAFVNLMTSKRESLASELADLAASRIGAGDWPWSFFCWPEGRPRPAFPSAFRLLAHSGRDGQVGVAVRCPACGRLSVNLVTREHLDVPFYNDATIGVVGHMLDDDIDATVEAFHAELATSAFDARRLDLQ
jgi:hypothetical protein